MLLNCFGNISVMFPAPVLSFGGCFIRLEKLACCPGFCGVARFGGIACGKLLSHCAVASALGRKQQCTGLHLTDLSRNFVDFRNNAG